LLYLGEVFGDSHLENIITEYSYICKRKSLKALEGYGGNEKWSHRSEGVLDQETEVLQIVLPGHVVASATRAKVDIVSYRALGGTLYRPVRIHGSDI
jgi:hypothetical protein